MGAYFLGFQLLHKDHQGRKHTINLRSSKFCFIEIKAWQGIRDWSGVFDECFLKFTNSFELD